MSATATDANATVSITPADADDGTDGHQVDLSPGRNAVTVTVTAGDGVTTMVYTVSVNRGVTALTGWKAADDLDGLIAAGNVQPQGVWSDGTTMWIADRDDAKLYAYRVSDGARDSARDFDTLASINGNPFGIWSDGATMWVGDVTVGKLFAYRMSDRERDHDKEFNTLSAAGNDAPTGIWSDGTTMWVADLAADKLFAYRMSDRNRDSDKDFDTLADDNDPTGNNDPAGIWSDGATMWVADGSQGKLYAYRMSDKVRVPAKDFDTLIAAGNNDPRGIWSDSLTMWVADFGDDKVYSYNAGVVSIVLSESSLTVEEGDTTRASYTVRLATQPSEDVTLTVSGHDSTDLTLEGLSATDTLTFTRANWYSEQTITVKAADDADGADDAVTLAHAASGGNYAGVSAELKVTVTDDDRGIVFTPTSLTVEEGDTTGASYTVKLATEPSEEVTVTVSGQAGTDLTLSGLSPTSTLTFTTANWNTAQMVTVKAADDADGADDTVTLAHAASGGNYAGVSAELKVTVTDDDRGIVFTPTSLTVDEGDTTGASYVVKLATEPSEDVTVTVSGHDSTDLTVDGLSAENTLTFTTSNWNTAQMVTVKAADDADGADDAVTLTHTASGGNYAGVSAELKVTVTDDDRGIVFTPTSLTVEEGDTTGASYAVKLSTEPSEDVTVTVSGHSGTDLTLSGLSPTSTLTFTTANWNTAQMVTVKAADDADGADDAVTLTHTASGGNYEDVSAELKVTVTDDDRGIVFTPTSLTVEEGDATGETYTVKLATEPSEDVTVTVSGHSGTDLTLSGLSPTSTLTFTTANWDTAQTVTVKAADDEDGADDAVTLAHAATGGDYAGVSAELKVTVTDDDRGIVFTPTSLTVDEGDTTGASYMVKLSTEPSEDVTVTVSGHDSTDLTVDGLSAENTLTFTTSNWDTAQTVTVKAADDEDGADDAVTLAHAASGGNYEDVSAELKVTVTDDDRGIVFTPTSLTVEEGDTNGASYAVKLATEPSEEVTVTISGQAGTDLTLSGLSPTSTLTFTTANWDTAQTVTVKAADDEDGADDAVTLAHAATGGDYAGVSADLKVTVTDDDRGIVFTPTSLTVEEGDATGASYAVKLATQPSEEVTVTVSGPVRDGPDPERPERRERPHLHHRQLGHRPDGHRQGRR